MNIIKKILENLRPDSGRVSKKKSGTTGKSKVTNKILYQELIKHFEADIDELSVGRRVLYPMSFNILLHPTDYKSVGESLPFILPEVIAGFYKAIKAKCDEVPYSYATNPAKYWFFQFASSRVKTSENTDSFIVPGKIVTVGRLTTFDIKRAQQGSFSENIKISIKCQNSNVNANNINPEALLGMDILTNNAYTFNFDKDMSEEREDILSTQRGSKYVYATLTYSNGPYNVHLSMLDDLVIVSGPKEQRNIENILIINNDAVDVGHIQIRYVKENNKFQLCAYSKTRLNMCEVPMSVGGIPIWKDLPFNSNIFLSDEVTIKFIASEGIQKR